VGRLFAPGVKKHVVCPMKFLLVFMMIWIATGCSSSSNHSKQVDYIKSKALLEFNQNLVVVPVEVSQIDSDQVIDVYPRWVIEPGEVYNYPVGVSCRLIDGNSYQGILDAKNFAKEEARLQLFQKLSGDQKVSAREVFTDKNGEKDVSLIIKRHSRGLLPANKVINEIIIDNKSKKELCLAVSLLE
jgi:hypothetical protein